MYLDVVDFCPACFEQLVVRCDDSEHLADSLAHVLGRGVVSEGRFRFCHRGELGEAIGATDEVQKDCRAGPGPPETGAFDYEAFVADLNQDGRVIAGFLRGDHGREGCQGEDGANSQFHGPRIRLFQRPRTL
jgi:hypothetical protein